MMRSNVFVLLFCALVHYSHGFAFVNKPMTMGQAQPEVETKTKTTVKQAQKQKQIQKEKLKTGEPVQRRDDDFEEAPMFKLMLLGDVGYDIEHVVLRMCSVMEDMDEGQAATVFQQAQASGKAMCGMYPFERAELFKEQLIRSTPMIFADMEEE
jgi:ATP-dependent Clp protease adapter protein ClpS